MANWKKVIVSGSAAELASLQLDTALPVAQGGIGASSLTDKAVLISQDSGTDAVGSLALTSNGSLIIGGTSGPAVEAASDLAGSGLAATTGDGTLALSIGAGTGIDVAADEISVDVSDFMANGSNNRIVTATGADAMNAEANLTFDGNGLSVTGHVSASGNISGSATSTGSFGRLQTLGASEIGGNLTQKGGTFLIESSDVPTVKSLSAQALVIDQRIPTNPGQVYNQLRFASSGGVELRQFSTIVKLSNSAGSANYWKFEQNTLSSPDGVGNVSGSATSTATFGNYGGNVSGSSTSTGSFGSLKISDAHQGDLLIQGDSTTAKLKIRPNANTGDSELHFSRYNRDNAGFIEYGHTADRMSFYAAGPAQRLSLDSTGATINQALSVGTSITAGGNISGSATSTGSFGRIETAGDVAIDNGNVSGSATSTGSFGFITGSKIQGTFLGDGNSLDLSSNSTIGSNIFSTVAVSGQSNIVADSNSDTLTLAESTGLGITTNAGSDTVTFALDSAQTTIQTLFNTSLVVGRASGDTTIDFTADDVIVFDAGASEKMRVDTSGVDITGVLTVSSNATIQGDLVVNGSTTTLSTTNLAVGDQFIFAATGSAGSNVDAGLVVQSGSAANTGSAFYHDIDSQRWAVAKTVASNAVAVTPNQFVTTVTLNSNPPSDSNGEYGVGEMWVETDTQDIFIRTG